jgi:sugar lactone lactonase YvrE
VPVRRAVESARRSAHNLLDGGAFFESPRWRDGRWWVSDFYRHLVLRVDVDGRTEEIMSVDGQPSGLGWMPDGSLLVVSMRDHRILRRWPDGAVTEHADVGAVCGGHLNDMVVDRAGRAYVGNFGFDLMAGADPVPASLARVDPVGAVSVAAEDLLFANGSVITPDGRTLIVGETAGSRYTAFTIEPDGSLTGRRVWAQVAPAPELTTFAETLANLRFGPDGCALDADGHIWSADEVGARCVRLAPGGEIVDEIAAPDGLDCFACMLGGDDGRTLLICAAPPDFTEASRASTRDAVLLTATVDVPHAGLP